MRLCHAHRQLSTRRTNRLDQDEAGPSMWDDLFARQLCAVSSRAGTWVQFRNGIECLREQGGMFLMAETVDQRNPKSTLRRSKRGEQTGGRRVVRTVCPSLESFETRQLLTVGAGLVIPAAVVPIPQPSEIELIPSVPTPTYGEAWTVTAKLPENGSAGAIDRVQFVVDGVEIGAPVPVKDGQAVSPTLNGLAAGVRQITVVPLDSGETFEGPTPLMLETPVLEIVVAKAPLIVRANPVAIERFDDPAAALNQPGVIGFEGFVNGEDPSVLVGQAIATTSATSSSPIGRYAIAVDVSGVVAANYELLTQDGELTIHPKILDVRARWNGRSISILGLNRTLPFPTLQAIEVVFSDPMTFPLSSDRPALVRSNGQGVGSLNFNPASTVAIFSFAKAPQAERLTLRVGPGLPSKTDASLTLLRGFNQNVTILAGDVNGDGVVTAADIARIRNLIALGGSDPFADLNGDNAVTTTDMGLIQRRIGTRLPV